MNTHICLVSAQLLPNVIPVLDEDVDRVILISSPQMKDKHNLLQKFFQERGKEVFSYEVDVFDFNAVLTTCRSVMEAHPQDELTLNVTGGTKLTALAAWHQFWFAARRVRFIYVDTENLLLHELGQGAAAKPLPEHLLSVEEHLQCLGKKVAGAATPAGEPERREATAELAYFLVNHPKEQRRLNGLVAEYAEQERKRKAEKSLIIRPAMFKQKGEELCRILRETGTGRAASGGAVNLKTRAGRFYAGGGWLEEYVYGTIADANIPGLDLAMNVELEWHEEQARQAATKNELDVVFTWHHRLHVISCKTSAIDQKGSLKKGKEVLYELDSLTEKVGGLYARPMLVSLHRLSETSRRRAKNLRIDVIDGKDVLLLTRRLEETWGIRERLEEEAGFS